jgi:hypothetical protein
MIKNLCQVAAHFPVNFDGLGDGRKVFALGPSGHFCKGLSKITSNTRFVQDPAELFRHGGLTFLRRGIHCTKQAVAGAQSAGQHLERVGNLIIELVPSPRSQHIQNNVEKYRCQESKEERGGQPTQKESNDSSQEGGRSSHQQVVARLLLKAARVQAVAAEEPVTSRLDTLVKGTDCVFGQPGQA